MKMQPMAVDQLLTPAEVAAILFVDPKTVTRWARAGKLDAIRTPGGHRRYLRSDVLAIMTGEHESQHPERASVEEGEDDPSSGTRSLTVSAESHAWPDTEEASGVSSTESMAVALEAEADQAAAAVITTAAAVTAAAQKAAATAARARTARALASAEAERRAADRAVRDALGQSAASAPWAASGSGSPTSGGEVGSTSEHATRAGGVATTSRQSDAQVPTQRGS